MYHNSVLVILGECCRKSFQQFMRAPTLAHRRRTREKRKRLHCQDDRVGEEAFVEPQVGTDGILKLKSQVR